MVPQLIEVVARERYQALLAEAEQKRLYKMLPPQASNPTKATERIKYWLGMHLVEWGLQLQGVSIAAVPQLRESEPYNC